MVKTAYRLFIATVLYAVLTIPCPAKPALLIAANQLGYLTGDIKSAVVAASIPLEGKRFDLVDAGSDIAVYSSSVGRNLGPYGGFARHYRIDFSSVTTPGSYALKVQGERSYAFTIGDHVYDRLVDSLLLFFQVQRCGNTNPLLHKPCHLHDITGLIGNGPAVRVKIDLTGGWHDAGDYIKFLNTTAYAAYTLMFAYEFEPSIFDQRKEGIPDVLGEAKIGLDWLLKLWVPDRGLITQVQDLRDHDEGWRLPEDDVLSFDRPGYVGMGKNLVGIYAATMALAARVWRDALHDSAFAGRCLTAAEDIYSMRDQVPDVDSSGTGTYRDTRFAGKLALGAAELYLTTRREEYLKQAIPLAIKAGADHWWSWGDVNSFAHYRLAGKDKRLLKYIRENLVAARDTARRRMFGEAVESRWGSNMSILGVALQAILWKRLTGESTFDTLATLQRDYILGRNQWNISFISNIGTNFSRHFHSQVAYLKGGYLPGAVAAGPIRAAILQQFKMPLDGKDIYEDLQTETATYRDDRMDWITNEPTITGGATAVFVMAYYAGVQSMTQLFPGDNQ